ncbi:MAG: hypothetical protein AAGI03_15050 [Pseudomonadota bacterium]
MVNRPSFRGQWVVSALSMAIAGLLPKTGEADIGALPATVSDAMEVCTVQTEDALAIRARLEPLGWRADPEKAEIAREAMALAKMYEEGTYTEDPGDRLPEELNSARTWASNEVGYVTRQERAGLVAIGPGGETLIVMHAFVRVSCWLVVESEVTGDTLRAGLPRLRGTVEHTAMTVSNFETENSGSENAGVTAMLLEPDPEALHRIEPSRRPLAPIIYTYTALR